MIVDMQKQRFLFWYLIGKLALYTGFAIAVLIFHEQLLFQLKYFIGGLMAFYGAEDIVFLLIMHKKEFYRQDKVYFGFVEFVLGIGMLFAPLEIEAICMIWATWSIMREAVEIKEVIVELKAWTPRLISLVESIAVIILSMILIFLPDDAHASTHLRILTVELVLTPLVPLLDLVIGSFKAKKALEKSEEEKKEE